MRKSIITCAMALLMGCSFSSCTQLRAKMAGLLSAETAQADANSDGMDKEFETRKLSIVKKCGESAGYTSGIIVKADYPVGNSVVAQAVAKWIAGYSVGSGYEGDLTDGEALFAQYAEEFKKENSSETIRKFIGEMGDENSESGGEDSFEWYNDINIVKEYDGKYIVSYTYQWSGFPVGAATSNATIKDCTFSKIDGSALGWEMFTSKKALKQLIDNALIAKFGREGADIYDNGIPMPKAPLFLKDSVRFDYGDYSIVEPHVVEAMGFYPYCAIAYKDLANLLTDEAKQYLGLAGGKPKARAQQGVVAGKMQDFLSEMDNYINKFDADYLDIFYSENVKLFGTQMTKDKALKAIGNQVGKFNDYEQLSICPRVTKIDDRTIRCDYIKRVTISGKQTDYETYLVLVKDDNGLYTIVEESDKTTDRNLSKR